MIWKEVQKNTYIVFNKIHFSMKIKKEFWIFCIILVLNEIQYKSLQNKKYIKNKTNNFVIFFIILTQCVHLGCYTHVSPIKLSSLPLMLNSVNLLKFWTDSIQLMGIDCSNSAFHAMRIFCMSSLTSFIDLCVTCSFLPLNQNR